MCNKNNVNKCYFVADAQCFLLFKEMSQNNMYVILLV